MTVEGFWTLLLILGVIYLIVTGVRAWITIGRRIDTDAQLMDPCATGHQWQRYGDGRFCLGCGERHQMLEVFDVDLAAGSDLSKWEREVEQ